jgi:hypothetical protein
MDFMYDTLVIGQQIRVLTSLDTYTRKCLGLVAQARFIGGEVGAHLGAHCRRSPGAHDDRCGQRD